MNRISIETKRLNFYIWGVSGGEKSRGGNGFSIEPFMTLIGPLFKIGGLRLFFGIVPVLIRQHVLPILNLSITPGAG